MTTYFERILLVAGAQGTGKSTQLRSMFRDPRLGTCRQVPTARNVAHSYSLSPDRSLYLRLSSPHEKLESPHEFVRKIRRYAFQERWCVASAIQVEAAGRMPDLTTTVRFLQRELKPERIRIALLNPDRRGDQLKSLPQLLALRTSNVVESPFAAVRLRIGASKRFKRVENAEAIIWKLLTVAEKRFRKLNAPHLLAEVAAGVVFEDGIRKSNRSQARAA